MEAYAALDRLNSAIRARSGVPAKAVYEMKYIAIRQAHAEGLIERYRLIGLDVKCRDCGGTGRYYHWSGDELDHCWACRNTGKAHLQFYETRLSAGITWHTPKDRMPWFGPDFQMPALEEPAGDWAVNTPGKPLTVAEIARDLMTAEKEFQRPHIGRHYSIRENEAYKYKLDLGHVPYRCSFCGIEIDGEDWKTYSRYAVSRDRIEWSDLACKACDDKYPRDASIFADFPIPVALVQDEQVQQWIREHCTVELIQHVMEASCK